MGIDRGGKAVLDDPGQRKPGERTDISLHPKPSVCIAFIISNVSGKDWIVTECGIGGLFLVSLDDPPEFSLSTLTQESVRHQSSAWLISWDHPSMLSGRV